MAQMRRYFELLAHGAAAAPLQLEMLVAQREVLQARRREYDHLRYLDGKVAYWQAIRLVTRRAPPGLPADSFRAARRRHAPHRQTSIIALNVNGRDLKADVEPDTPLLWVLRDELGLTGTKFGCGMALCGACTVHLDGQPVRSCVTPVSRGGRQEDHHHRRPRPTAAAPGAGGLGASRTCRSAATASPGRS